MWAVAPDATVGSSAKTAEIPSVNEKATFRVKFKPVRPWCRVTD
jgi:hypothetical protein